MRDRANKALTKKSKKGFKGYPVATVALYGPTDKKATKLVVCLASTILSGLTTIKMAG